MPIICRLAGAASWTPDLDRLACIIVCAVNSLASSNFPCCCLQVGSSGEAGWMLKCKGKFGLG